MTTINSLFFKRTLSISNKDFIRSRAPISGLTSKNTFGFEQKLYGDHLFMETGKGTPIIYCHGLFGSYRNFAQIAQGLADHYRIIVPCMPMYDAPLRDCTVLQLAKYLERFIEDLGLKNVILAGNSMGGGTILHYTLKNPENVSKIMLFSSSGLSFVAMRGGFLRLGNYDYVKSLLSDIFYNIPSIVEEDDYREVYNLMQNKTVLLRCLNLTRSTKTFFPEDQLRALNIPALIIWGENDTVIPPEMALEFQKCLTNSEVHFIPECGHCPPFEHPDQCLSHIRSFLKKA